MEREIWARAQDYKMQTLVEPKFKNHMSAACVNTVVAGYYV